MLENVGLVDRLEVTLYITHIFPHLLLCKVIIFLLVTIILAYKLRPITTDSAYHQKLIINGHSTNHRAHHLRVRRS